MFEDLTSSDVAAWASVVVSLLLAWISHRTQRDRRELEYLVLSNQALVSPRVASDLDVHFRGRPVPDPSLVVVRMVSTGDKGIPASAFETPMELVLDGAQEVVTASVSAARPAALDVEFTWVGNRVSIQPLLLNAGDLIELQVLASGRARSVNLEARIADVNPKRRTSLPYPPGSGPEGEMLIFDKMMWFFAPVVLFALSILYLRTADARPGTFLGWSVAAAVLLFVLYPMRVRTLVRRRRNWRP